MIPGSNLRLHVQLIKISLTNIKGRCAPFHYLHYNNFCA